MYITIEFNAQGISQLLSAIDDNGAAYDYFIQRVETRETFKTLIGPITEVQTAYYAVRESTGERSAPLSLAGAQALVNARNINATASRARPDSCEVCGDPTPLTKHDHNRPFSVEQAEEGYWKQVTDYERNRGNA